MRKLYIKQKVFKILDHYPITDENGNAFYQVDQEFKFFGHRVHVTTSTGKPVFTINRVILTWLPRSIVTFADGREMTLQSRFSFLRRKIDIDAGNLDLRLEGGYMDMDFSIMQSDKEVGHIRKVWFSFSDQYELTILAPELEQVIIAIVIAVDQLKDAAASRSANS